MESQHHRKDFCKLNIFSNSFLIVLTFVEVTGLALVADTLWLSTKSLTGPEHL